MCIVCSVGCVFSVFVCGGVCVWVWCLCVAFVCGGVFVSVVCVVWGACVCGVVFVCV